MEDLLLPTARLYANTAQGEAFASPCIFLLYHRPHGSRRAGGPLRDTAVC